MPITDDCVAVLETWSTAYNRARDSSDSAAVGQLYDTATQAEQRLMGMAPSVASIEALARIVTRIMTDEGPDAAPSYAPLIIAIRDHAAALNPT